MARALHGPAGPRHRRRWRSAAKHGSHLDLSQLPVTFELRFSEELIERRFLRKSLVLRGVVRHVARLVPAQHRLEANHDAIGCRSSVDKAIADPADIAVAS